MVQFHPAVCQEKMERDPLNILIVTYQTLSPISPAYNDVSGGERHVVLHRVEHLRHLRVHLAEQRPAVPLAATVPRPPAGHHSTWRRRATETSRWR